VAGARHLAPQRAPVRARRRPRLYRQERGIRRSSIPAHDISVSTA
jgi:hypothetical protein